MLIHLQNYRIPRKVNLQMVPAASACAACQENLLIAAETTGHNKSLRGGASEQWPVTEAHCVCGYPAHTYPARPPSSSLLTEITRIGG